MPLCDVTPQDQKKCDQFCLTDYYAILFLKGDAWGSETPPHNTLGTATEYNEHSKSPLLVPGMSRSSIYMTLTWHYVAGGFSFNPEKNRNWSIPGHRLRRLPDIETIYPVNTRHRPNVAVMLGHHLRRCPNITAALGRRLVFAG